MVFKLHKLYFQSKLTQFLVIKLQFYNKQNPFTIQYLHLNIQLICTFFLEYIAIYIRKYINITHIHLSFFAYEL